MALQRRLRAADVLEHQAITGYFGTEDRGAVKRFQRRRTERERQGRRATWKKLVAKTGKILIKKPQVAAEERSTAPRCKTSGRALCIDKTSGSSTT